MADLDPIDSATGGDVEAWAATSVPPPVGARRASGRDPWSTDLTGVVAAAVAANLAVAALVLPVRFFAWVRVTYALNTLWLPAALLALAGWRLRRGHRRAAAIPAVLALALLAVRGWATHVEPARLQVRQVELESQRVAEPVRILHISDLQSDRVGGYEERTFARMRELEPDLVLFTGDLLQPWPPATWAGELARVRSLLASLGPPLGSFGVCGNTDVHELCSTGIGEVGGLEILAGAGRVVPRARDGIAVYGLQLMASHHGDGFPSAAAQWLERQRAAGRLTVVLGHAPDFALAAPRELVDLALAGHTHGGQIRVPFVGPLLTLSAVPRDWARGFRRVEPMALNVSAGLGAEHAAGLPSIRFNCPPEMTVIDVIPKS